MQVLKAISAAALYLVFGPASAAVVQEERSESPTEPETLKEEAVAE
jgi:hypothetical protein